MSFPFLTYNHIPPSNTAVYPNYVIQLDPCFQNQQNLGLTYSNQYLEAFFQYRRFHLQSQLQNLVQLQQNQRHYMSRFENIKSEETISPISSREHPKGSYTPFKLEETYKIEESDFESISSVKGLKIEEFQEKQSSNPLRTSVVQILYFFLNEFGKINQENITHQRAKYNNNTSLLQLFDALVERYLSASKCREDMIRFVLRKALSYLRDSLRNKHNLTSKAASLAFCQRYFNNKVEEMVQCEVDIDDEKEVLNFLLPYKKNSRNRTANNRFITEIFTSDVFYGDYLEYLDNFDEIMKKDNQKKINKFVDFLVDCVKNDTISKVKRFKRLPWLNGWLETSKVIAYELLNTNILKGFHKKQKLAPNKKSDETNCVKENRIS